MWRGEGNSSEGKSFAGDFGRKVRRVVKGMTRLVVGKGFSLGGKRASKSDWGGKEVS